MKEHPILFSAPMIRAILEGRKTMTRRTTWLEHINQAPDHWYIDADGLMADRTTGELMGINEPRSCCPYAIMCPYGQPGDRLWVRETWGTTSDYSNLSPNKIPKTARIFYQPNTSYPKDDPFQSRIRPSIHMPRWASRILLEVTDIRVERLQDIVEKDAIKEGIEYQDSFTSHVGLFQDLWESINAKRGYGWGTNPWVWAISFKRKDLSHAAD